MKSVLEELFYGNLCPNTDCRIKKRRQGAYGLYRRSSSIQKYSMESLTPIAIFDIIIGDIR